MTKPKTTKPASPWQKIETAKYDGGRKILLASADATIIGSVAKDGHLVINAQGALLSFAQGMLPATHWMPIPPLPEGER